MQYFHKFVIFLQIQSKHKDLYSAVLVPNNVEQTLSNSAALNRAVKNQRECVLQLFEFSVKEILNGRCTGEEYRNPKYSQMDRYDWMLSYIRLLTEKWKISRKLVPNFSLLWMKLSQWEWCCLPVTIQNLFPGPSDPTRPGPCNLYSFKPSQAAACHHPSPEIVFLPYLALQMLHYQKDLPMPQCLKYIFPYHALPPLCWVIFLHSSNITFNVSFSFVYLYFMRSGTSSVLFFYYVPGPW